MGLSRYHSSSFLLVWLMGAKDRSASKMLCLVGAVVWRYACDLHRRIQISSRLTCSVPMTMSLSMWRSSYAYVYSSWTIAFAVVIHALSQVASRKYWSLCHGCKTVHQGRPDKVDEWNWLTHGYLVDFSVISQGVVFVEMGFAECKWSTKCRWEPQVLASCGEVHINMIHSRNHGGQILGCCQNSVLKGKNTFQEVWKECRQVWGFGVCSSEK